VDTIEVTDADDCDLPIAGKFVEAAEDVH